MKQIKEELHIRVEYLPNGYFDRGDEWELNISINEDNTGQKNISPFGSNRHYKDLTVNEICAYIKEAIEEELFNGR